MKCIIHIGLHKTGSTAIQDYLSGYEDDLNFYASLSEEGILGHKNHSIPIVGLFKTDYHSYRTFKNHNLSNKEIEDLRSYWKERLTLALIKSKRYEKSIFISGEEISNLKHEELESLINFIRQYQKNIYVVGYIRDPISFARSSFQQELKFGLAKVPKKISQKFIKKCNNFINILGKENVLIKEFHKDKLKNNSVVDDFANIFSLKVDQNKTYNNNSSLSADAIKILFKINKFLEINNNYNSFYIRKRAISLLQKIFLDDRKIPIDLFASIADYKANKWAKNNYDIEFPVKDFTKADTSSLQNWLSENLDKLEFQLISFLKKNNITADNLNYIDKLLELCAKKDFNKSKLSF